MRNIHKSIGDAIGEPIDFYDQIEDYRDAMAEARTDGTKVRRDPREHRQRKVITVHGMDHSDISWYRKKYEGDCCSNRKE